MSRNAGFSQSQDFEEYVESVKAKAEDLVKNVFPRRVKELNQLLDSKLMDVEAQGQNLDQELNIPVPDSQAIARALQADALSNNHHHPPTDPPERKRRKMNNHQQQNHEEEEEGKGDAEAALNCIRPGTKVLALPTGPVPCNKIILEIFGLVKPQIRQLVEISNLLKMWVTFLIPKIEDGNNFGVSIQEDTLGEIRTVEAETATFYEQITRYHMSRAKLISKVAKYPHVTDYRRVIVELDEKEFLSMRLVVSEIRNHYASLYDLISKNWEKIIKPRTSNAENLY